MPKTIDRPRPGVNLTVSSPPEPSASVSPRLDYVPWVAVAVVGSLACVLLGWLLVGMTLSVGWLTAPGLAPATVLESIGQAWLGVHGVTFRLAGVIISITPLGLSALVATGMAAVSRYAVAQFDGAGSATPWRTAARVAAVCTVAYTLSAVLLASLVGAPRQALDCVAGAALISGGGSTIGALRACFADSPRERWWRHLPAGVLAGLAALTAASLAALALALASHTKQLAALQGGLAPDAVGAALLVVAYLAYAPNVLLWVGSYVLGSGFTLGAGTQLTPWTAQIGLLPSLPLAGALPAVPPQYGTVFLLAGPIAGAVAGLTLCRRLRPEVSVLGRAWRSGLAGLVASTAWVGLSWISRGGLGAGRLALMGPRFPELLASCIGVVSLCAAATGAIVAWVLRRRERTRSADDDPDATAPLGLD